MSRKPTHDADPELEAIRELGLLAHQHRKASRSIGVSSGTMSAIWIVLGTILVVALVALALAMR
jgi:hypothetical protein